MKKTLISAENISDFLGAGASEFHADNSMILTSGAKDYLREKKVKIIYGSKVPAASTDGPCRVDNLKNVVERIVSLLRNEFQVQDAATVERVTRRVLQGLNQK